MIDDVVSLHFVLEKLSEAYLEDRTDDLHVRRLLLRLKSVLDCVSLQVGRLSKFRLDDVLSVRCSPLEARNAEAVVQVDVWRQSRVLL